jgi:seryl-tRNA synthetase
VIDVKDLSENPDKFRASQRARGADESVVDEIISDSSDSSASPWWMRSSRQTPHGERH